MAKFGKEAFPQNYQGLVGMGASERLHRNSLELAHILLDNDILKTDMTLYEFGSGPARNLTYILKELTLLAENQNTDSVTAKFYASDLWDCTKNQMHDDIRQVINYTIGDTEDVANNNIVPNLDLLLVSDHLMHLQYDKADNVIKKVASHWKPKHILLRELKKRAETPEHPRLHHNYDQLLDAYKKIVDTSSEQDDDYFIWLLKRK